MTNYYIPLNSPRLPRSWNCCFNAPRPPHIRDIPPFPVELEAKPRANTPYWFILPQG